MDSAKVKVEVFYRTAYKASHPDHPGIEAEGETVNGACRALALVTGDQFEVFQPARGRGDTPDAARLAALLAAVDIAKQEVVDDGG